MDLRKWNEILMTAPEVVFLDGTHTGIIANDVGDGTAAGSAE